MVAGNPVKKILLKLNLSDHRSTLTDSKVSPTKPERMTKPYLSPRFIANCFNAGYLKMEVESVKVKEFQERCNIKAFQIKQTRNRMSIGPESQVHTKMAKSQDCEEEFVLALYDLKMLNDHNVKYSIKEQAQSEITSSQQHIHKRIKRLS
ncbi:hypothetical protein Tco_0411814 [Tanacetum coccineum]